MKTYIIVSTLLIIAGFVPSRTSGKMPKEVAKECLQENNMEDLKKLEKDDPKLKCFFNCLKVKAGLIVDGKVVLEKLVEKLGKYRDLTEEQKESVKGCTEMANQQEGCEVGAALSKCLMDKGIVKVQQKPTKKEGGEE